MYSQSIFANTTYKIQSNIVGATLSNKQCSFNRFISNQNVNLRLFQSYLTCNHRKDRKFQSQIPYYGTANIFYPSTSSISVDAKMNYSDSNSNFSNENHKNHATPPRESNPFILDSIDSSFMDTHTSNNNNVSANNIYTGFDINKNISTLQTEGFTKEQSEAIVALIEEAIQEGMQNITKSMITKQEQQEHSIQSKELFNSLKHSIQSLSDKNTNVLMQDLNKLRNEVRELDSIMKEQVSRVQGNLLLDMNLERGRMKEEIKELEEKLDAVKKSVDTEVKVVVDKVVEINEELKDSMTR